MQKFKFVAQILLISVLIGAAEGLVVGCLGGLIWAVTMGRG